MKPDFERNEEQEEALNLAIVNWILCGIVYVILIVVGGIIGGTTGALGGAWIGGLVCGFWSYVAWSFYDYSRTPMIGNKLPFEPTAHKNAKKKE